MKEEMKQKDLKNFRISKLPKKCPICKRDLTIENSVVDHIHTSHKSIFPETFSLIREVICSDCNVLVGKIENQYLRSSRAYKDATDLPEIIRNIADYIEKYSSKENFEDLIIHPKEVKPKKIKKSWFNKFKKEVKEKFNKELTYPKSGKIVKEISFYIEKLNYNIDDIFY